MAQDVPKLKLNDGQEMPMLGLGTWKSDPGVLKEVVERAIDVGYRHFDCALIYDNEKQVGEGLKTKLDAEVVGRDDLFITSKLWNSMHRPDLVVPGLKESLSNLGLDYLNLYLIHWPVAFQEGEDLLPKDDSGTFLFSDADFVETWKAMEECVGLGLTKSIGVSNFNSEQLQRILDVCKIRPALNQIECHPYLSQKKLIEFCKEKGIEITAYSPFGSPANPWSKDSDPKVLEDPVILQIAKKLGKSAAQVAIRWQIQRGVIVIPKTATMTRVVENFDIFNFSLSQEDIGEIEELNRNSRIIAAPFMKGSKYYPFNIDF